MSMIVTGMEMPKSCGGCNASGTGVCRKWFDVKELGSKRSEHCPLKSVDGLIEELKHCADRKLGIALGCNNLNERQKQMEAVNTYQRCISIIKEYCGMEDAE